MRAEFTIGDIRFFCRSAYPGGGAGWQFEGGTFGNSKLPIGELIRTIATHFGTDVAVPVAVSGATVQRVQTSFNTGTKDFHFSIDAKLPLGEESDGPEIDIVLTLDLVHHGEVFEKKFAGHVDIGNRKFELDFASSSGGKEGDSSGLVASYQNNLGDTITLSEMLEAAGVSADDVPDLSVSLKFAFFAIEKPGDGESWKVFGLNIDAGLDLTGLPLIGKVVPAGQSLSLQLQALYSSLEIKSEDGPQRVAPVNTLLRSSLRSFSCEASALITPAAEWRSVGASCGSRRTAMPGRRSFGPRI